MISQQSHSHTYPLNNQPLLHHHCILLPHGLPGLQFCQTWLFGDLCVRVYHSQNENRNLIGDYQKRACREGGWCGELIHSAGMGSNGPSSILNVLHVHTFICESRCKMLMHCQCPGLTCRQQVKYTNSTN